MPACVAHSGVLAAIHQAAFPPAERWSDASLAGQLVLPGTFGLLHPAGAFILARAAWDEAEVLTVAAVPSARRRGLGRALLTGAMQEAAARGAASMFLEVARGNAAALCLYRAAGFAQVGLRAGYYPGGEDALVLRGRLSPCAAPVR